MYRIIIYLASYLDTKQNNKKKHEQKPNKIGGWWGVLFPYDSYTIRDTEKRSFLVATFLRIFLQCASQAK